MPLLSNYLVKIFWNTQTEFLPNGELTLFPLQYLQIPLATNLSPFCMKMASLLHTMPNIRHWSSGTVGKLRVLPPVWKLKQKWIFSAYLPGSRIHGLEFSDKCLGQTFNSELDVQSVALVVSEESVWDCHTNGQRCGRLLTSNNPVLVGSTISIFVLLVFPELVRNES